MHDIKSHMQVNFNRRLKRILNDVYVEIDDQCSADEALQNFDGDFDSIDRYEKNLVLISNVLPRIFFFFLLV